MTSKNNIIEALSFTGALLFIISGIFLKLSAPVGLGLFVLYSGRNSASGYLKTNLIWDFIFLGISSVVLLFRREIIVWNSSILFISMMGIIYFEILFRISLQKKNRIAVILILVLFIVSGGAFILGGQWLKGDSILGFLSLTFTVIISFRKTYAGLIHILS